MFKILEHLPYVLKPPLNAHSEVSRRVRGIKFCLRLSLFPCFANTRSKSSGQTVHVRRLV